MDNKTPDNKQEFKWTDELVKEFVEGAIRVQNSLPNQVSLDLGILHFKKSKEHKVEEGSYYYKSYMSGYQMGYKDGAKYGNIAPNEPLSDSIPTLERQFSEPKVYNQNGQQLKNIDWGNTICTTKEKLDAMMKNVWDAARLTHPLVGMKFDTFEDYQISLPENKPQESKQDSKGWRIESFRGIGNNNKGLFTLDKLDGLYYFDTWKENKVEGMALHEMNYETSAKSVEIFQVRRLSDGEVFSVGDKVNCDKCPKSFSQQTIEKFQLGHSGVMIASCAGVATSINNISKLPLTEQPKQVLFTTEDKVSLYNVNSYCIWVNVENYRMGQQSFIHKGMADHKGFKYFSTESAAEKYILMNKPCLSVKDVLSEWSTWFRDFEKAVKQLAKNKKHNPLNKEHKI